MTYHLRCLDQSLSVGSLASYIHWVNQIPLLSQEEEQELFFQLRNDNNLEAARKLVLAHLRLVVKIARGYSGYGLQQADLIQEGNIGLMKAVKRFNPELGVRLVSFAIHWIRAEIHEFVIKNWRIVKIATTKAQRKLFFNLRKMAKERAWFSNEEVKSISEMLNVTHKEIRQMEARLNNYDESFDGYEDENEKGSTPNWYSPANYLEDQSQNPESQLENEDWVNKREEKLHLALNILDKRSQDILHSRWLKEEKETLSELSKRHKISAERVRQLEKSAMKKLLEVISS